MDGVDLRSFDKEAQEHFYMRHTKSSQAFPPNLAPPLSKLILGQKFIDGDVIKIGVKDDELTFEK